MGDEVARNHQAGVVAATLGRGDVRVVVADAVTGGAFQTLCGAPRQEGLLPEAADASVSQSAGDSIKADHCVFHTLAQHIRQVCRFLLLPDS